MFNMDGKIGEQIDEVIRDAKEVKEFVEAFFADGKEKTVKDWLDYCDKNPSFYEKASNDMTVINGEALGMNGNNINDNVIRSLTIEGYGMVSDVDYIHPTTENNPFTFAVNGANDEFFGTFNMSDLEQAKCELRDNVCNEYYESSLDGAGIERVNALLDFIREESGDDSYELYDIVLVDNSYSYDSLKDHEFETPIGTFYVLTEEESYKFMEEDIESLIDECGLMNCFGDYTDYVVDNYVKWDGEDWFKEDYQSYFEDIESECDGYGIFENRLQSELFEILVQDDVNCDFEQYKEYREEKTTLEADMDNIRAFIDDLKEFVLNSGEIGEDMDGTLSPYREGDTTFDTVIEWINDSHRDESREALEEIMEDYFKDEYSYLDEYRDIDEWFDTYEDKKDELIEQAVDKRVEDLDGNYFEEYKFQFGDDGVKHLISNGEVEIDYKGIAEWTVTNDGFGRISSYDGQDNEQGGFHIYKEDDKCIERKSVSEEEREEREA